MQPGFVQLSQEVDVSMQMSDIESEQLSSMVGNESERNSLSLSVEVAAEIIRELTAVRDNLLLLWNHYKVSKENMGHQVSGEVVIVNVMTASVKQPKRR